jgi:hypothetical protein
MRKLETLTLTTTSTISTSGGIQRDPSVYMGQKLREEDKRKKRNRKGKSRF